MSQKTEHEKLHGDIVGFRFVIVIVGHRSELGKGLLTFQVEKLLSLTLLKNVKKIYFLSRQLEKTTRTLLTRKVNVIPR
jgi:hypothetical protein